MVKVHAEHLRLAPVHDWVIPKDSDQPLRRAAYVIPPIEEEESSSESDGNTPLQK